MAKFIITDTESGRKLEILTNDDRVPQSNDRVV